jgi:hypothetical protein
VYDNELRLPGSEDTLTLPELLQTIGDSVWTELGEKCPADRDDRNPMISSLRRNLQREHLQRLIDLVLEESNATAAYRPISNLARLELRKLADRADATMERCGKKMDAYTEAHLTESKERIDRVLKAGYHYDRGNEQSAVRIMVIGEEAEPVRDRSRQ